MMEKNWFYSYLFVSLQHYGENVPLQPIRNKFNPLNFISMGNSIETKKSEATIRGKYLNQDIDDPMKMPASLLGQLLLVLRLAGDNRGITDITTTSN